METDKKKKTPAPEIPKIHVKLSEAEKRLMNESWNDPEVDLVQFSSKRVPWGSAKLKAKETPENTDSGAGG